MELYQFITVMILGSSIIAVSFINIRRNKRREIKTELGTFGTTFNQMQEYSKTVIDDLKADNLKLRQAINGYKQRYNRDMEEEQEAEEEEQEQQINKVNYDLDTLIPLAAKKFNKSEREVRGLIALIGKKKVQKMINSDEGKMLIESYINSPDTKSETASKEAPSNFYSL